MPEAAGSQKFVGSTSPWSDGGRSYVLGPSQENVAASNRIISVAEATSAFSEITQGLHLGGEDGLMKETNDIQAEVTLRLIKAELDAGLARIGAVESDIRADLAKMPSRYEFYGLAITMVALIVAIWAWGGDRFDGGVQVATGFSQHAIEAQLLARQNAEQINALAERAERNDVQIEAIYKALVGNGGGKVPDGQNE